MAVDEKKQRADLLAKALEQITKDHGKGAIMRLGDPSASMNVSGIPTGEQGLKPG